MNDFESKVLAGLKAGVNCKHLGFAVSGGADSISLLTAASELLKENKICCEKIFVITVNHFIRSDDETCGDADFVLEYCKQLNSFGLPVEGFCYALKKGQVESAAFERNGGIEDAARYLRYEKFEQFINDKKIDYLCLAHNQNDQLETLVMRFLQGSSGNAAGGIKSEREKFLRPLLNISRKEIEQYLIEKNISWRTDSTNNETEYLRNRIRLNLLPLLDEQFPGWKTGVLSGAEKQVNNSKVIEQLVDEIKIEKKLEESDCFYVNQNAFFKYGIGVQIPLLLKLCNLVSSNSRVPYVFLKSVCSEIWDCVNSGENKSISQRFSDIEILYKNKKIIVKKYVKNETDLCFFDIIEENGTFQFPFGVLTFSLIESGKSFVRWNEGEEGIIVQLPVCVRNAQPGDVVKTASGNYKKVSDVFSDWKVSEKNRALIPVIQDLSGEQKILCILGKSCGFNNWIVKE